MKKLRVLHAPYETAGQASLLVGALRSVGYQSKLLVYQKHKFGYEYDLFFDDQNEKLKFIKLPWLFLNLVKQFDILSCVAAMQFGLGFTYPFKDYSVEGKEDSVERWREADNRYPYDKAIRIDRDVYSDLPRVLSKVVLEKNRLGISVPQELFDLGAAHSVIVTRGLGVIRGADTIKIMDKISEFPYYSQ